MTSSGAFSTSLIRIRPFYLFLLLLVSVALLLFSWFIPANRPLQMKITLREQMVKTTTLTHFEVLVTDSKGLAIETARLEAQARSGVTYQQARNLTIQQLRDGHFDVALQLDATGIWDIRFLATAQGFVQSEQLFRLEVTD